MTSFELFVATRYLRAQRKQVMISVITVISIIGVAAGVMALVIALAITNGFRSSLEGSLLGATAHVSILEKETAVGIDNWQQISQKLSKIPHVTSASPGLYDSGYINGPVTGSGAVIKGILVPSASVPDALRHLKSGSLEGLISKTGEMPGIILGSRLADNIGAVVGKPVQLLVPNGELIGPLGPRPSLKKLRVAGIFESGFYDLDLNWAFMALPEVQKAFGLDDVVNSIELRLDDIYKSDEVAAAADSIIGPKLTATTWQEQNRQLLVSLKMERVVIVITVGLIQLVAALNILIALVMMVMEKHRDIAILLSMGAKVRQIRKIFILEGALIGSVGTSLGLIIGYLVCFLADRYHWLKLDEQVYSLAYVPFSPRWADAIWIAAAAIAVSLVATLYPARSATRIAPVEALRYE